VRMCTYFAGLICAYVCIHAWACSRPCVHIRAGMITPMCAYMHAGMIVPLCAYKCRHDCGYLVCRLVGMKILRVSDKTKRDQLEMHDSACAHRCANMLMRHSGKLFGTILGTKFGCLWQQSGEALQQPCL
jgi:hypothetical protein